MINGYQPQNRLSIMRVVGVGGFAPLAEVNCMKSKQNTMNFYQSKKIEIMPRMGECENVLFPFNGFNEHPLNETTGKDWFGVDWEFMEAAGAATPSCTVPHVMTDICKWREQVQFPDLDNWDWEEAARIDNVDSIDRENEVFVLTQLQGPWERTHSLMGFEEALLAIMEEPEAIEEFFEAMTQWKIKLITKLHEYYKPDVILFHDDYGTQRGMFFSPDTWRAMLKDRLARIVDCTHELGMTFGLHSCGKYEEIVPDLCEIGVDMIQCMDILDLSRVLAETDGRMSFQASVHTQLFESMDKAGELTPEYVRERCYREFMEWGKTGHYTAFIFPPSHWYEEIVSDVFEEVRQQLAGTYTR